MSRPAPASRRLLLACLGAFVALVAGLLVPVAHSGAQTSETPTGTTSTATTPADPDTPAGEPCFGAAAVDPFSPCSNPGLDLTVYPPPARARALQQNMGCDHREAGGSGYLDICFFGAPERSATRTVALLGDSHAAHWRNALDAVLAAHNWRAVSMQRAGCPLTLAVPDLPTEDRVAGCMRFNEEVQKWMRAHPEIDVVFTSQHRGEAQPTRTLTANQARLAGYTKAWRTLLRGRVRHIVVIRDTPRIASSTIACVEQAIADHVPAGPACALKSSYALRSDPAADAAKRLDSPKVQVADLATFFCRKRLCPPVEGGALVLRDVTHMTTTFSTTLGPYLLQRVNVLMAAWPDRY